MAEKIVNYNDINKVKDLFTLDLLKEDFEKAYNKQKKVVETLAMAKGMKNQKFGFIKESFETLSPELFKSKEGRVIIGKYINVIKESEDLKKVHTLYECVRRAGKDIDVTTYLNEAISMVGGVNKRNFVLGTQKLGTVLSEACEKLGKDKVERLTSACLEDRGKLDEAIEFVCLNKKSPKTLLEYTTSCDVIKNHINLHESLRRLAAPNSMDIDKSVNEFNERYGSELTESEQALVKELVEGTDKEGVFNKYKENCIKKINEKKNVFESAGDAMSSERMGIILEKVTKKKFNPETANTDVFNLFEMANSIE